MFFKLQNKLTSFDIKVPNDDADLPPHFKEGVEEEIKRVQVGLQAVESRREFLKLKVQQNHTDALLRALASISTEAKT